MNIVAPRRAARTFTQSLIAPPARVFPLLCPVREADWIEGWDPVDVFTRSGIAELDCVFVTASTPHNAVWYVTRHEPDVYVEMIKITPGVTACKLSIGLRATDGGTEATVTYTHTSLSPEGDAFIETFTEAYYWHFMRDWERRMNHYLAHGKALRENG